MGGKGREKKCQVHERFATRQGSAMRYDTVRCNAMRFDGKWTRELTRLDSTRTTGQGGTARERRERFARFTSPTSPSISQSSIVNPSTDVASAQYLTVHQELQPGQPRNPPPPPAKLQLQKA